MSFGMYCGAHPRPSEIKIIKVNAQWLMIKAKLYRALFERIRFPELATKTRAELGFDATHLSRVIAKVEWHPANSIRASASSSPTCRDPPRTRSPFYNERGICEQWIKEVKGTIKWTRLSCRSFAANAVRLQLHALAYNLGNFLRTLATPEPIKDWSMTSLKEKLIKIGAKVVRHGRYIAFQMAEVAISRHLFADILRLIAELRPRPDPAPA
jgi:hypothetical protein